MANAILTCVIGSGICDSIGIWPVKLIWTVIHSGSEQDFHFAICSLECHCETGIWHCRLMPAIGIEAFQSAGTRLGFSNQSAIWPNRNGSVAIQTVIANVKQIEIYRIAGIPNGTGWSRANWNDYDSVGFRNGNDLPVGNSIWNHGVPKNIPVLGPLVVCRYGCDCHDSSPNRNQILHCPAFVPCRSKPRSDGF